MTKFMFQYQERHGSKMRLVPVFNKSGTQIDKGIDLKVVTE